MMRSWVRHAKRVTDTIHAAAPPPPPPPPQAVPTPFNSADAADDESSPAAQYSTRLEHMDTLVLHREPSTRRWEDLDQAERELTAFCTMLGPEDETEKCWQAYSYLEQRREDAVASCDWEHPESCSELEHLNEMARQLISTGSMDDLVATFSSLARVAELRRGQAAGPQEAQAHEAPPPDPGAVAEADAVHSLFQRMDLNGDGRCAQRGRVRTALRSAGQGRS